MSPNLYSATLTTADLLYNGYINDYKENRMSLTSKAKKLAQVLEDAKNAKPIAESRNVYSPDDYDKMRKAALLEAQATGGEDALSGIAPGAIERNPDGSVKKIRRWDAQIVDVDALCSNRYKISTQGVSVPKADKEGNPVLNDKGKQVYTTVKTQNLVVVWDNSVVNAIANTQELPPQVRVHNFVKDADGWVYTGASFIKAEEAYKMTERFNNTSMLQLIKLINESDVVPTEEGDDLNSL